MRTIILGGCLLLLSCNVSPEVGQWYEHRGTRERIQVKYVGKGTDCYGAAKSSADMFNSVFKRTRGFEPFKVLYRQEDSSAQCILFSDDPDITREFFLAYHHIIPVETLKRDYSPVK